MVLITLEQNKGCVKACNLSILGWCWNWAHIMGKYYCNIHKRV